MAEGKSALIREQGKTSSWTTRRARATIVLVGQRVVEMPRASEIRDAARAQGLAVKRNNALTATLCGGLLAVTLAKFFSIKPVGLFSGILLGVVYANGFEYCLHRFLLHLHGGLLERQHMVHHSTWGSPEEPLYVNFARAPWVVVALFLINAVPVAVVEWVFPSGVAPGMLIAFAVYFVIHEEVHWRIHMGGWLPSWLRYARRHHLMHHAGAEERFNVFLPLFDWIFGSLER